MAGDLNDVAWSYTTRLFIKISELLDPRMGRGFFQYVSCGLPLHAMATGPRVPLSPLSFAQYSSGLPYYGSDHFPMYVAINYEPREDNDEMQESADEEEKELAESKINAIIL